MSIPKPPLNVSIVKVEIGLVETGFVKIELIFKPTEVPAVIAEVSVKLKSVCVELVVAVQGIVVGAPVSIAMVQDDPVSPAVLAVTPSGTPSLTTPPLGTAFLGVKITS